MTIALDRPVVLLGGGGHARVLLDLLGLLGATVLGVTTADGKGEPPLPGVAVIGDDNAVARHAPTDVLLVNAVGYVRASDQRKRVQERFSAVGYRFPALVHPAAVVSAFATLGDGCQIMAGAVVQAGARIGRGVIVNTLASVDHDCLIGAYAHIAPGANLSGSVHVGECSVIGVGAVVRQGVYIGSMSTVGAGSAVVGDLPGNVCVGGVPARPLEKFSKNG